MRTTNIYLLSFLMIFGSTYADYNINKEVICFNNKNDLSYNFILGNYNCPNYIIHLKKEVNSSRDNIVTIYHNEKNVMSMNTSNIKSTNIFEYKSKEDCKEDIISLRIFYNCENMKYYNNESIDMLKVNFYSKKQLSNNVNYVNNYIKNIEYDLLINYKNLLEHIYNYKNYYYILSSLILLYVI